MGHSVTKVNPVTQSMYDSIPASYKSAEKSEYQGVELWTYKWYGWKGAFIVGGQIHEISGYTTRVMTIHHCQNMIKRELARLELQKTGRIGLEGGKG